METLLKINILLLLFYGFYILILEKYKLLLYNRIYLIFGIITSIGLPFFNYTKNVTIKIPETNDKLYNTKINDLTSNSFVESTTTNLTIDYLSIFYWISVIIIGIFLIKMFFAMFQLYLLYKNGTKINILNTDVIQHEKITNPFSFVKIFLPIKKLNNLDLIILHEKAHCVQKHYLDNIIAHVLRAFFWYNPIVWLYKNAIIQNLEFLADEAVIQENINKKQYQLSLIEILKQNNFPNYSLTNAYSESLTLKRIKMMNQKINPKGNWKFLVILPLLSIFFMFFQQKTVTNIVITNKENTNKKLYLIQNNFTENEIENKFKEFNAQYDLNLDLEEIEYNENNKIKHIKIGYLKENFSLTKKDGISGIDMRFSKDNFYISPIKYKNNDPRELAIINTKKNKISKNYIFNINKKTSKDKIINELQNLGEKFKIQYVLKDIKYNDKNEIIYLNIGKKLNGKIEDFIVKDTNGIGETTILYTKNNKTGKINSVIYSTLNNKIEKVNNSNKDNIYEVNEYIFNKKSTESEIMNTLDKMSNKFEVKLYLKSICFNKDKEITKLIIFYQDKFGKKDTFETMNNEGIDDVFVGLRRKKNKNAEYKIHTLGGKNSKKVGYSVNEVRKLNEQELAQYEKDMKQYEDDMKQLEKDIKQHEKDIKQHEIDMKQHEIDSTSKKTQHF